MDYLLVRDGTVPIAIAQVVAFDDSIEALDEFLADRDGDLEVELHSVGVVGPGIIIDYSEAPRYIGACWFDGDGFTLVGFNDVREGLEWLAEDGLGHPVKTETYAIGHWGATYPSGDPDDPRGYGHLFQV